MRSWNIVSDNRSQERTSRMRIALRFTLTISRIFPPVFWFIFSLENSWDISRLLKFHICCMIMLRSLNKRNGTFQLRDIIELQISSDVHSLQHRVARTRTLIWTSVPLIIATLLTILDNWTRVPQSKGLPENEAKQLQIYQSRGTRANWFRLIIHRLLLQSFRSRINSVIAWL